MIVKFGTFNFNTYEIIGEYVGTETIEIRGFENSFETEKFEYNITINIPNMDNVFISNIQEYGATVWFSPGVGLVKMEGCALFIDPIAGISLNIADSNKVIRHSLTNQ
ncbi:MAG: hypothetical protein GY936_08630 [Ignavibacteriae bacterium]|nr:hypothetical protein [Ignavibacteriota bacterium]